MPYCVNSYLVIFLLTYDLYVQPSWKEEVLTYEDSKKTLPKEEKIVFIRINNLLHY